MDDQPKPHELSTIIFYGPDGVSKSWDNAVLISLQGNVLTFLDKEERLNVLSGGSFHIAQQGKLPEASPIVKPGKPQLSIIGRN